MLNSIGKLGTSVQKPHPNPVTHQTSPLSTGKVQQEKLTMQTFDAQQPSATIATDAENQV